MMSFFLKKHLEGPGGLSLRFRTTRTIGSQIISAPLARYITAIEDRISVVINNTDELLHKLVSGNSVALVEGIMMTWILIPWFSEQSPSYLYVLPAMYLPGSVQLGTFWEPSAYTGAWMGEPGIFWRRIWISEYPPV